MRTVSFRGREAGLPGSFGAQLIQSWSPDGEFGLQDLECNVWEQNKEKGVIQ